MCVLALAWRAHPIWRLVLAGNRDELHMRPAQPLARWDKPSHVLAGTDLRSGGTWLGVSEQGRLATVTNLRGFGPRLTQGPSRGALVADVLSGKGRYADPVRADLTVFNPFNLITVEGDEAVFTTNRPTPARRVLEPGVYGLSNGALDEPWPKTAQLKAAMRDWLAVASGPEALLAALRLETLSAPAEQRIGPSDVPQEPAVSPIFIRNPVYGTRCSTVVAIDDNGAGLIIERRFKPNGDWDGETAMPFVWPGHL